MKYRYAFLFYLAAFFIRPVLWGLFPLIGDHMDLVLCLTVVFTFIYDDVLPGLFFGPIFALLQDVLYGEYIGPSALSLSVVVILVLIVREYVNTENILNAVLALLFSTWLFASLYWSVYYLAGSPYTYAFAMKILPLRLLFNTAAGTVLYLILIRSVVRHRKDRYFR